MSEYEGVRVIGLGRIVGRDKGVRVIGLGRIVSRDKGVSCPLGSSTYIWT